MGAKLTNPQLKIQAGIDPKTGLPVKEGSPEDSAYRLAMEKLIKRKDKAQAINRYKWYNLPDGLTGHLLERILYYKGQGAFFYMEADNKFYFLPYALDGNIDVYGRYTGITPLPFAGGTTNDGKEKPWITGLNRKPVYSIKLDELTYDDIIESCVLLKDYSPDIAQTVIPRDTLNKNFIEPMSEMFPYMRTALMLGSGIKGMRVDDADQSNQVKNASMNIKSAALKGEAYVPVIAPTELQELTDGAPRLGEEYMLAFQAMDNFRLSTYGIENGGVFQKKAQVLQAEQAMNGGNVDLVYQDGLTLRQEFCDIVNSIWGLGIWCEPSESVLGYDANVDGKLYDENNASIGGNDNGMGNNTGSDDSTI